MMRVLHILMNDPENPTGGLGVAVKGIIEAQKKIGIKPYVLGYNDYDLKGRNADDALIADLTGEKPHTNIDLWYLRHIWECVTKQLCARWKNLEFDIIHLHDSWMYPVAELAEALYQCPVVYTNHLSFTVENWGWKGWNKLSGEEARMEVRCLTRFYNTHVSLPYAKKVIAQYDLDQLIPNHLSAVIHNGVSPLDETEQVQLSGKNVYFCGRAVSSKGVNLVVKAAENLPDFNFHVFSKVTSDHKMVGTTERLLESAQILLPNFHWYSWHTEAQKCAYLRACDIALVPSINDAPFEITGLEAMLAGTPLITTAACGMRDYCNDENCTIIEPTAQALTDAIKNHVRDQDKLRNAYETAKSFSWDAAAEKYKTFYRMVYAKDLHPRHAA